MKNLHAVFWCLLLLAISCKSKEAAPEDEEVDPADVRIPVTVVSLESTPLQDYIDLNATSAFQQTNSIKASANGYLKAVNIRPAQLVHAGQLAFTLQTKEAHALGNTINKLDPSFNFSGIISIRASATGYILSLDHQPGDYVQDGEQLATMADEKSFGFVLNLPVEYRRYVGYGKKLQIDLPDGSHMNGTVSTILPNIDSVSQTENVLIKPASTAGIPQNLIAKVRVVTAEKSGAPSLPKAAVLTDEGQTNFWVMKMIDSITAVKVPVLKGMETKDRVEILHPRFSSADKFLLSGNYGLPDTVKVKIMKGEE